MDYTYLIGLLGGLALFLYGMQMMSTGLESAAGNRIKLILEKLTANDEIRRYKKQKIGKFYLEGKNRKQILQIFPELIQDIMGNKNIYTNEIM